MFDFTLRDDSENTLQKCGVYKITCTSNGKFYVGCTYKSFNQRLAQHRCHLKRKDHHSRHMQNCFNKHGLNSFKIEILEIIPKNNLTSIDFVFEREDYWINLLQPHLNSPINYNNIDFNDNSTERKGKTGYSCIHTHKEGYVVEVQDKYIGFYKELPSAIKARDDFFALPIEQQVAKQRKPSNTGHMNIQYREKTKRYRVIFGDDEVASSCKTLEEAIEVKERFLATGERPHNQKAGSGYKYLTETKAGHWAFSYKRKRIATYSTLEEALVARDTYIRSQNDSGDCGSNSMTSVSDFSEYNPKSSSDTQSS